MRSIAALAACACVLGGVGFAFADTMSTFSVGSWEAGASSVNGTSKFDHCAAFARYRNGTNMLFAVSRTLQWSMGFENPNWSLKPGQSYPIAFTIDRDSPSLGTAVALNKTEVEVQLASNLPRFERFMHGEVLRVEAAAQNFTFDLTDTVELLPALLRCVQSHTNEQVDSNPFEK
jgi:hypothetical protein